MDFMRIMAEQKEERDSLPLDSYCRRSQMRELDVFSPLAQVVIGMRRSGKTVLCHQALHEAGVPYAYINFDDESLANLESSQFNELLQAAYVVYGDVKHIFLDEIQNPEGWELFVNRLLRQGMHVVLTGSNSNLLSQELGTHLTGRYKEIELLPFSFREYLDFSHIPTQSATTRGTARLLEAYQNYAMVGGLPESHLVRDRRNYIKTLYNAILFKDVTRRYNVRYPKVLSQLSSILLDNFCREVNYSDIANALSLKGIHTLQNYASYLEKAYLIKLLAKFSYKPLRRQQHEKAYAMDMGMVSAFTGITVNGENAGWRMENIVFLKLYSEREKNDYELFYWKNGCEIDFVLVRKQVVLKLVQVAYDISAPKTRQRETKALLYAAKRLSCDNLLLVTLSERTTIEEDGKSIQVLPITEFLLEAQE